jgi:SecD/SecF fusion protein
MSYITRNLLLSILVVVACLASIFPVDKNLRLGKDLAGGVNLVYTVDVKPDDPPDTVERTIQVLRDRVNPDGLFEISMTQQGRDRIEISMPLPNERVQRLRATYDTALSQFDGYTLDGDAFLVALRQTGEARDQALERLSDSPGRKALLEPVRDAARKAQDTRAAFETARTAGSASEAELATLLDAAAQAETALEEAREKVLDSIVSTERVRVAMELPSRSIKLVDRKAKEEIVVPSSRERALEDVRSKVGSLPGAADVLANIEKAHADFAATRIGFDDPADLIRLLQGSGVLNFRIAIRPGARLDEERIRREVSERGPENVRVEGAGWFRLNAIENWFDKPAELRALRDNAPVYFASRYGAVVEEYAGSYYMLLHDVPGKRITKAEGEWALSRATPSIDDLGRPSVSFNMNPRGAILMGELTESNIRESMAMVLDDRVYSTATIQSRISSNGQISGNFSQQDINYLIKTLNAGSLTAKLSERPISQSVTAPELGADNLERGLKAAYLCFIFIGVFMIGYYFLGGGIAMVALIVNAIFVLGVMSLNRAAFTLPGIAGVVLTFGTAVDSNVLIYERIREELLAGQTPQNAVRAAFRRVGTTLIDANMVHLLVCLVLVYTGTQEIKGFGITLGIGVVGTLFCAVIVTRLIYTIMIERMQLGVWSLNQLPLAFPWVQRAMTWRTDWMRLFPTFMVLSVIFTGIGLYFVFAAGEKLLDSEFRGGTAITLRLKEGQDGQPAAFLKRDEVQDRVVAIAKQAEAQGNRALAELRNADVVAVDAQPDGVTSATFAIRTTIIDADALQGAIASAFSDVVESRPPVAFVGSGSVAPETAPIFPVVDERLGASIGRPEVVNDVARYLGGVAIVLENLDPPLPREVLNSRLEYTRGSPAYSTTALRRDHTLIVLEGDESAVRSAAVVVHDSTLNAFDDEAKWRATVVAQEWDLTRDALTKPQVLATFNTFEPAIAATFRAQAIVAITLSMLLVSTYVWIRFGSIRYAMAAIIPLLHDTLVAVGMVAMAEIIYKHVPGAAAIGIRPIKIDLGMVAAIMTIIGYSLNDTIVTLDRIRENRGKLAYATKEVINNSINQTLSRTLITAGTTMVSLLVLFFVGGEAIASFAYTMIVGTIVGTYSSIAIAAPIVYTRNVPPPAADSRVTPFDDRRDHSLPAQAGI